MIREPVGVGIIGVNPTRGWAATAHIPALRALPYYEIRALSSTTRDSAAAAGAAFGVATTLTGHRDLVVLPQVDLVVVTVKAPHHRELVTAALAAGKAVYCEWPLGVDLAEATALTDLAIGQKLPTLIGLQARQAPAIEYAREMVAARYVGDVLSTTMVGSSLPGAVIGQANAYMLDTATGANLLTVAVGHSLDALAFVLGEFRELSATSDTRRPVVTVLETGEQIVKTAPDHIAVIGRLTSGAIVNVHFREGMAGGIGFLWEINGTQGTIRLAADSGLPGIYPVTISGIQGAGALVELSVPPFYADRWPTLSELAGSPAYNVGRTYATFADDLRDGTHRAPDFTHGLHRHHTIADIAAAAASGQRKRL